MTRSDGFDSHTNKAKRDYVNGKSDQQETWGSKENLFSPGQLTPSAKYKENYDRIKWGPK